MICWHCVRLMLFYAIEAPLIVAWAWLVTLARIRVSLDWPHRTINVRLADVDV